MSQPKMLSKSFLIFPFLAALLILIMMTLVIVLTPGGVRQSLGFNLQQEETWLSDVTNWQNVSVAGGAAQLRLPQVLEQQGNRWVLSSNQGVRFSTAWNEVGAGWSAKATLPPYDRLLDASPLALSGLEGTSYTLERGAQVEQHAFIMSPDGGHALEVTVAAPDLNTLQGLEPTLGSVLRSVQFAAS